MTGTGRRFDLAELSNGPEALTEAEIVGATAIARDLEAIAERDDAPTVAFSDKVMATIAAEPTPKPTRVFGAALRTRRFGTAVSAVGDAWRVAFGGGRPFSVRGQALALILVVLIGVLGLGGGAAVGAARLLNPDVAPTPTPEPSVPAPSPSPASSHHRRHRRRRRPIRRPRRAPSRQIRLNRPKPTIRAATGVPAVDQVPARTIRARTTRALAAIRGRAEARGRESCPTTLPQMTPGRARAADRAPTTRGRLGR